MRTFQPFKWCCRHRVAHQATSYRARPPCPNLKAHTNGDAGERFMSATGVLDQRRAPHVRPDSLPFHKISLA
jgi:hypothetical protein